MKDTMESLLRDWDGTAVVESFDRPTGARILVALHDTSLGPAVGGTRLRRYAVPEEALRDAMRLAEGMTWKWAGIDLPFGGGKAVVDVPGPLRGEARRGFFRRYGRLLEALGGAFSTGVDLGTDPEDMDVLAAHTRHVMCGRAGEGGSLDPGPFTALGVFEGIRAALEHRFGNPEPADRAVLVQGLGDVGEPLARRLAEAGARLSLADVDRERATGLARELGAKVVEAGKVYDQPCDVFCPCAVGGILDDRTIPRLRCAIVAGSANNQLDEESRHAALLHGRDVLYAPDWVVNAGGALAFGLVHAGLTDRGELERRVRELGDRLREIFREAAGRDESPLEAARRVAARRLEAARGRDG